MSALEQPLLDAAVYHCQQAAEKTVKGWLQLQDDPFPHDIAALVNQAAKVEEDFKQFATSSRRVDAFVSVFRYPGGSDDPMPSHEEFDEALQHV